MSTLISGKPSSGEKKGKKKKKLKRQIIIYHDDSTLHWHVVIHFIGKKLFMLNSYSFTRLYCGVMNVNVKLQVVKKIKIKSLM